MKKNGKTPTLTLSRETIRSLKIKSDIKAGIIPTLLTLCSLACTKGGLCDDRAV
jgi:hypothetical protein